MPNRLCKGKKKGPGKPAMNRSKQAGMSVKTIVAVLLVGLLLALGLSAEAQQPKKVPRIGIVGGSPEQSSSTKMLRQALQELGYVEGKNILFVYRSNEGIRDRVPGIVAELIS